jgi:hypothetical protein
METDEYAAARAGYLAKFPQAAVNFQLGDFALYDIEPQAARYVAGFGKAFNLWRDSFLNRSRIQSLIGADWRQFRQSFTLDPIQSV